MYRRSPHDTIFGTQNIIKLSEESCCSSANTIVERKILSLFLDYFMFINILFQTVLKVALSRFSWCQIFVLRFSSSLQPKIYVDQKTQTLINNNLEFFDLRKFLVAKRRKIGARSFGTN